MAAMLQDSERVKGECMDLWGVSVFVSEGELYSTGLLWTGRQAPLARQPLLPLKSLPERLSLQKRPCHLEGEWV